MNPAQSPFLADPSLLRAFEKWSGPISCDETRLLFCQGEVSTGLFILHSGEAILEMRCCDTGQTVIRFQAPGGSLLGLPAVLTNQPYSLSATALQGARVSFITRSRCLELLQSDTALSLNALQIMAAETHAARSQIFSLICQQQTKVDAQSPKNGRIESPSRRVTWR